MPGSPPWPRSWSRRSTRQVSNGETLGLVAFVAAIVGGFDQVRGAIAGGLLVGMLDNLAAAYVSTAYRQAIR